GCTCSGQLFTLSESCNYYSICDRMKLNTNTAVPPVTTKKSSVSHHTQITRQLEEYGVLPVRKIPLIGISSYREILRFCIRCHPYITLIIEGNVDWVNRIFGVTNTYIIYRRSNHQRFPI